MGNGLGRYHNEYAFHCPATDCTNIWYDFDNHHFFIGVVKSYCAA